MSIHESASTYTIQSVYIHDCNRVSRVCVCLSESVEILSGSKLTLEVHTHTKYYDKTAA